MLVHVEVVSKIVVIGGIGLWELGRGRGKAPVGVGRSLQATILRYTAPVLRKIRLDFSINLISNSFNKIKNERKTNHGRQKRSEQGTGKGNSIQELWER